MANVKISLLPSQNDILQVDGLAGYAVQAQASAVNSKFSYQPHNLHRGLYLLVHPTNRMWYARPLAV